MFPVYAGMIRLSSSSPWEQVRVPRLRGDDPTSGILHARSLECSLPTRG